MKKSKLHIQKERKYEFLELQYKTLYEVVKDTALTYPKRKSFYFKGKYYSYSFLLKRINQYAASLKSLGFKKNDVITICLPNVPESLYLLYGTNQIGAIANIIHPLMGKNQLEDIMKKVDSKILFILDTRYKDFKYLEDKLNIKVYPISPVSESNLILKEGYKLLNKKDLDFVPTFDTSKFRKAEPLPFNNYHKDYLKDSIYLHSGGTTGTPKTIALSSSSINTLIGDAFNILAIDKGEIAYVLSVLPMFHGFGLSICIHIALAIGGCDMLMPKFSSDETVKLIKKDRCSFIVGIPTLFEALYRNKGFKGKKLENLIECFVGGDFVNQNLLDKFNAKIKENGGMGRLFTGYGLTETVTVCMVNNFYEHKDGSIGKPLKRVKALVVDQDLNVLPPNKEGEIVVGGPYLMNGYRFDSEDQNDKVFVNITGKKYVRTGDYGYVDEDGFFFFKQRIKRLIKVNGINIFPNDIENVLSKLDFIYESAAIGVQDEKRGEMVKLFVVLERNSKINKDEAIKIINQTIVDNCSIYAKPKEIVFIDSLPKTLIGKIDYKELK